MFSVIIPSKNAQNLLPCVAAVRKYEPEATIFVIDDGLLFTGAPFGSGSRVILIPGRKPFVFAGNINIGLRRTFETCKHFDSTVILNDDALLETPGGFSLLARAAEEQTEYGIISATTNVAGNPSQKPMGIGLRDEPRTVAFICVLIARRTIEAVGLLDEQFGGTAADGRRIYGFCDNDYCRRTRNAGLKIGIHDGAFVDHGSLRSEFRGDPHCAGDISAAGELYTKKWGDWL